MRLSDPHPRKIGLAACQGGERFSLDSFPYTLVDFQPDGSRSLGVEILIRPESLTFWILCTLGRVFQSQLWSYSVLGLEFEECFQLLELYGVGG